MVCFLGGAYGSAHRDKQACRSGLLRSLASRAPRAQATVWRPPYWAVVITLIVVSTVNVCGSIYIFIANSLK